MFSFITDAIAGSFAANLLLGTEINRECLLGLIPAGNAEIDFIDGLIETNLPPVRIPPWIKRNKHFNVEDSFDSIP